jgi:hypothetical protein
LLPFLLHLSRILPFFFFGYSFFRYFALSVRAGKKCWVTLVVDPRKELRYFSDEGSKKAHLGSLLFFFFFPPYIFLLKQLAAAERRNRSHKRHFNSPHRGPESTRTLATFSGPLPCLLFRSAYCEQVYAFDIAIAGKIWTLGCDTREEMEDWIEVLRQWLFP